MLAMNAIQWQAVSDRAWRRGMAAADHGMYEEARFWLGRARLAARFARAGGTPVA
jgi:hypothetical protein